MSEPADKPRVYSSAAIDVSYSARRCIHAAECVTRLRAVFDTEKRPWIQPDQADADAIAATIHHCPTGALHYTRKDGGRAETPDATNTIRVQADGPNYLRGRLIVRDAAGQPLLEETRLALCRCGASQHKPFCDNSHRAAGFKAGDELAANAARSQPAEADDPTLVITPAVDGPILLQGPFTLMGADGVSMFSGTKGALCRCGQSANKPFCDGTHRKIGFSAP